MKPFFWLSVVALVMFVWMFRYDVHYSPDRIVRLDRWTGELQILIGTNGWQNFKDLGRSTQ